MLFDKSPFDKLSGNQLKFLALVLMTIDHIGRYLLPQYRILRVIGRLAFPIFAYMIAEGCQYTKHPKRYLGTMAAIAVAFQIVRGFATGSLYQCILVTFSLSLILIFAFQNAQKRDTFQAWALAGLALFLAFFISECMPRLLDGTNFQVDYGLGGILLPAFIYLGRNKGEKLFLCAMGLCVIAMQYSSIQWFSLLAIPLLAFYSGQRGEKKMKYLFYIYYPAHLGVIYILQQLFF